METDWSRECRIQLDGDVFGPGVWLNTDTLYLCGSVEVDLTWEVMLANEDHLI